MVKKLRHGSEAFHTKYAPFIHRDYGVGITARGRFIVKGLRITHESNLPLIVRRCRLSACAVYFVCGIDLQWKWLAHPAENDTRLALSVFSSDVQSHEWLKSSQEGGVYRSPPQPSFNAVSLIPLLPPPPVPFLRVEMDEWSIPP